MPELGGVGFDAVVVLAFLFVGWYIVGSIRQRRIAGRYVRVVGQAAERLAADPRATSIHWIGQAGFQIVVGDARPPFRRLSLLVLLSSREVLGLWLINLVRRRRDLVVARGELRAAPRGEVEAYRGRPPKDALGRIGAGWSGASVDGMTLRHSPGATGFAAAIRASLPLVRRLSLSREAPHLLAEFDGDRIVGSDGASLAEALAGIGAAGAGGAQ